MSYTTGEQFNKSFQQGNKGERIIGGQLHLHYKLNPIEYNKSKSIDNLRKWDIKGNIEGKEYLFEIKTDLYEFYKKKETGNMFIETKCGGKPSGIMATTSDYLVYYYPYQEIAYVMLIKELREWLKTNWQTHLTSGGDSNAAFGYLIPKVEIEKCNLFDVIRWIPKELYFDFNKLKKQNDSPV